MQEIAQDFEWDLANKIVMVPIGNAGNISAIMNGFLKFLHVGIIRELPNCPKLSGSSLPTQTLYTAIIWSLTKTNAGSSQWIPNPVWPRLP